MIVSNYGLNAGFNVGQMPLTGGCACSQSPLAPSIDQNPQMQVMQMMAMMQQLLGMMQMMMGGTAGFPGLGGMDGVPGPGGFPGGGMPGNGFPGGPGPSNPASTGTVMRSGKPIGAQIAQQYDAMVAAAARDGVSLRLNSGKRSYQEQVNLYNKYGPGRAARPGTSNHESGNALDFTNTPGAYQWLKRNAAQFGFYNKIPHEPWHYSTTGR